MDLFPVQRYLGDEDNLINDYGTAAKGNMCKLLSKINQRAKLKNQNIPNIKNEEVKRKKSKKRVSVENVDSMSTCNQDEYEHMEETLQKKSKLSKHIPEKGESSKSSDYDNKINVAPNSLLDDMDRLKVNDDDDDENVNEDLDEDDDVGDGNQETSSKKLAETSESEVFPVLGNYKFKKRNKVKRVLPDWLANPSVVSVDLKNLDVSINDIPGLHETFIKTLKKNNISHFFPVQAQVIPWMLHSIKQSSFFLPCDICVSAPTGSGKTLAYVIPILQALMNNRIGQIQALVVLPVQDLAAQVAAVFRTYCAGTDLKVHLSTGGLPLQDDRSHLLRQRLAFGWESLVDILVITPGRLVEHLYSTTGFSLKHLQYIVIDEADRIIDSMQNNWLHHLDLHLEVRGCPLPTLHSLTTCPRRPQRLLFSATLSTDPEKLTQLNLFHPRLFTSVVEATKDKGTDGEFIGKFTTPAELKEGMVRCTLAIKPLVLYRLITRDSWSRVLVFTSSSRSVHQLSALLTFLSRKSQQRLSVEEISAECSPSKRLRVLADFAAGKIDVLVSTDAFARGIDIPNIRYVVSYDMPKHVKAYIHRAGRTGRAGQEGLAVTLVTHSQVGMFQQMLQTAGKQDRVLDLKVDVEELKNLEEDFKEALRELKNITEGEALKKLKQTKYFKRGVASTKLSSKKRKKKKPAGSTAKKFKK